MKMIFGEYSNKHFSGSFIFSLMILFLTSCSVEKVDQLEVPDINVQFCTDCTRRADVVRYENKLSSILMTLSRFKIRKFWTNQQYPISETEYFRYTSALSFCDFYQRESFVPYFNEYILYCFKLDEGENFSDPHDTLFMNTWTIEFNCGTEPFGYDTTKANIKYLWEGRYPGMTPVRDVPLDSFKLGYYSIVKWLYDQETDRFKVRRRKYEQFDGDYGPTSSEIKSENLVLEDPWQEEFLFTTYELIDTRAKAGDDFPVMTVVPRTFAPIHLYEVRPPKSERENYVYAPDIYHINIADMAIRVYKHPLYEEL